MPDVFISYSRKNLDFVNQLISSLQAEDKVVWWDRKREALEGIMVGSPWWEQIKHGIETADNFLFVISPNSIVSPYCHAEINHARWCGKRLVTALYCHWISEEDTWKAIGAALDAIPVADELPNEVTQKPINFRSLARQNWLSLNEIQHAIFSSSTSFEEPFKQLVKALDQDFAWVKMYNRLRQAALLWDENGRSDDFLWSNGQLKPIYEMIKRQKPELDALVQDFIEPEQERLLRELKDVQTTNPRRLKIGERLADIGDTRPGVGVKIVNLSGRTLAVPEIDWCPVTLGGEIKIEGQVFQVQPFSIARYLITHQQFQSFRDDPDGFAKSQWWRGMPYEYQQQAVVKAHNQFPNAPRDNVDWYQAVAFCRWLDARYTQLGWKVNSKLQIRLPTEWEWQWAAQHGDEAWKYPWGTWDDQPHANTVEAGIGQSTAVGMHPDGAAACGALDMAGNLMEWCLNDYEALKQISLDNNKYKVLRGGSFLLTQSNAAASYRSRHDPSYRSYSSGFRVVVSSPIQAI